MIASIKYAFAVIPKFVAKINVKQWAIVKAVINLKMSIYFVKKEHQREIIYDHNLLPCVRHQI